MCAGQSSGLPLMDRITINMTKTRRVLVACVTSVVLNGAVLGLGASIDSDQHPAPLTSKILDVLGAPGSAAGYWPAPTGHGAAHFVGGALIEVLSSIIFYAALAWVVLSLPLWLRQRLGEGSRD